MAIEIPLAKAAFDMFMTVVKGGRGALDIREVTKAVDAAKRESFAADPNIANIGAAVALASAKVIVNSDTLFLESQLEKIELAQGKRRPAKRSARKKRLAKKAPAKKAPAKKAPAKKAPAKKAARKKARR